MWRIQFHIIGNWFVRSRVLVVIRCGRRVGRAITRDDSVEGEVLVEVAYRLARCVLHHSRSDLLRCIVGLCERTLNLNINILRRDDAVALRRERGDPRPEGEVALPRAIRIAQSIGDTRLRSPDNILRVILRLFKLQIIEDVLWRRGADRHFCTRDMPLLQVISGQITVLDILCPVIDLLRLTFGKGNRIVIQLERRDFTKSPRRRCKRIVPRICAREREVGVVDPVVLTRAVRRRPRRTFAAHILTLKLLRMTAGETDRIARHNTVRADLKTDL